MTNQNTNLNVDVNGDVTDLEAALRKGARDLKSYERSVNSAKRALDELERESLKASAEVSRAERNIAKATAEREKAEEQAWKSTQRSGSALGSLVGAAALVAPAVGAAGVAIGAFAALAAPSIYKVVAAQSDLGNQWVTLDDRQKVAAASTEALVDDYKRLAKSYEPEALAAYNNVLSTTRTLLPEIEPLAKTGATAFNNLATQIGDALTGPVWSNFFNTLSQRAIPDTQLLGNVAVNTGDAFAGLTQDLLPLGETLLQGAGGVTKLLAELSQVSPTTVQLGVSMYALYKPASALVGTAGSIATKFKGASKVMGLFGGEAKAASIGSGLLKDSAAGLPGIITGIVVVAGALALKFSSVKSEAELTTERIVAQNQAFGNNVAGYQGAIKATTSYLAYLKRTNLEVHTSEQNLSTNGYAIRQVEGALKTLTTQQHNVQVGEQQLGQQYGISADQAGALATAAGVDLSASIDRSGKLTTQATAKIAQYRAAVTLAQDPVRQIGIDLQTMANSSLDADTRLKALTAALDASINPSLAAYGDTTNLKNAQTQLASALKTSHGEMGLETAAARNSRAAFANYIQQTVKLAQDQYVLDSKTMGAKAATDKYRNTIINSLPKLYTYAGRNKSARQQVDALARAAGLAPKQVNALRAASEHAATKLKTAGDRAAYMRKMINLIKNHVNVTIDVNAEGSFTFTNKSYNPFGGGGSSLNVHRGKASGHAAGGGRVRGPGGSRSDKAGLYELSDGEFVVNAPATRKYLPQLMAMNDEGNRGTAYRPIGYAASGGFVTAGNGSQTGMRWEHQQAVDATAIRAGQAFKKLMASVGGGSGSKRWAPIILQVLSMLGMPASLLGGVETLINRESGGNPKAINLWDSNARAGHPSQGLMQTIPSTFNAYAGPFRSLGITNPLANIYAGLNYIRHNYPSLGPLRPGWVGGYDNGGRWPSGTIGINTTGHDERVLTPRENRAFEQLVARLPMTRIGMTEAMRPAAPAQNITINNNHVPGFTTEQDLTNAIGKAHRQQRLARAR